jgi:teichuronic acid exporter
MLKQRAAFATLWSAADVFLRQGLQLLVTIVLARLLSPEEFGTVALLSLFIGLSSVLVDSGFSSALIQKQNTTHEEESTVFWFNLAVGIFATMALCLAAPYIAAFYDKPILTNIVYATSLIIAVNASGSIHVALLTKRLDFLTQMKIGTIANSVSGVLAIFLAWQGFGIWSLVAQALSSSVLSSLLVWRLSSWRPKLQFEWASARGLFGFGGYMLTATLLDTLYSKGYSLLIGKFYGTRELGFYSQAENTKQFPANILSSILLRVAFPMLSAIANEKAKLQRATQLAIRSTMLLHIPMMLGLALVAGNFIKVMFGNQWLPAAHVLQVLCIAGIFWPLHAINVNVLLAQGHSKLILKLQIIKSILGIALLIIGARFGIMGIAWSQVAFSFSCFLLNTHYTEIHLHYGPIQQLRDNLPVLLACIPMIIAVHILETYWEAVPIIKLITLVSLGAALFFGISYLTGIAALKDIQDLFSKKSLSLADKASGVQTRL